MWYGNSKQDLSMKAMAPLSEEALEGEYPKLHEAFHDINLLPVFQNRFFFFRLDGCPLLITRFELRYFDPFLVLDEFSGPFWFLFSFKYLI